MHTRMRMCRVRAVHMPTFLPGRRPSRGCASRATPTWRRNAAKSGRATHTHTRTQPAPEARPPAQGMPSGPMGRQAARRVPADGRRLRWRSRAGLGPPRLALLAWPASLGPPRLALLAWRWARRRGRAALPPRTNHLLAFCPRRNLLLAFRPRRRRRRRRRRGRRRSRRSRTRASSSCTRASRRRSPTRRSRAACTRTTSCAACATSRRARRARRPRATARRAAGACRRRASRAGRPRRSRRMITCSRARCWPSTRRSPSARSPCCASASRC